MSGPEPRPSDPLDLSVYVDELNSLCAEFGCDVGERRLDWLRDRLQDCADLEREKLQEAPDRDARPASSWADLPARMLRHRRPVDLRIDHDCARKVIESLEGSPREELRLAAEIFRSSIEGELEREAADDPELAGEERFLIWSDEKAAWWRAERAGYTRAIDEAGRYLRAEALDICERSRLGPRPGGANAIMIREPE